MNACTANLRSSVPARPSAWCPTRSGRPGPRVYAGCHAKRRLDQGGRRRWTTAAGAAIPSGNARHGCAPRTQPLHVGCRRLEEAVEALDEVPMRPVEECEPLDRRPTDQRVRRAARVPAHDRDVASEDRAGHAGRIGADRRPHVPRPVVCRCTPIDLAHRQHAAEEECGCASYHHRTADGARDLCRTTRARCRRSRRRRAASSARGRSAAPRARTRPAR